MVGLSMVQDQERYPKPAKLRHTDREYIAKIRSKVTDTTRTSPILAFLPTFGEILLMITMASAFLTQEGPSRFLGDGDTGTHLRTGQLILASGSVPTTDQYSFSRTGRPWYAWEWMWDVAFAKINAWGGLTTVALVTLAVLCLTFYWLYRHSLSRSGNPVLAVMVTGLCMIESSNHWLARPHLFTFLFLVFAIWWIEKSRGASPLRLLVLPLLTMVWANVHGGFLILVLILASYSAGALLRALTNEDRTNRKADLLSGATYAATTAGCLLASLANPYGVSLLTHIVTYLQEPTLRARTSEFQLPNLTRIPLMALFSLDLLAILWFAVRKQYEYCLLIGGTAWMALGIVRHISVHSVVCAPFLAEAAIAWAVAGATRLPRWPFGEVLTSLMESGDELKSMRTSWRSFALPAVFALLLISGCILKVSPRFEASFIPQRFPVKAIEFLKTQPGPLSIFSDDETGDYVIYSLFPKAHVFIDGRLDFYGSAIFPEYDQLTLASHGWQRTLDRYRVNALVLEKKLKLTAAVREDSRWSKVHEDDRYVVFRR